MVKGGLSMAVMNRMAHAESTRRTPVVDAHIHLFDPTRAGGVPWPTSDDTVIFKPAVPERYEQVTRGLGVVAAIAIEASPLESDNDWVLKQAENHPMIVGMVGNLRPGSASFGRELERLRANPLFLGIRCGNLWQRDLAADVKERAFMDDLRKLGRAGLTLDSANPNADLVAALVEISQRAPELKIVLDHLPAAVIPAEETGRRAYWQSLQALSQNKHVFVKLSEVAERVAGRVPLDVAFYKDKLDAIWEIFGEDHVLFGSDWPNSDHFCGYREILGLVRSYVATKGPAATEKYFVRNSMAAYGWKRRAAGQPQS